MVRFHARRASALLVKNGVTSRVIRAAIETEERLDLLALFAQLVELALHAALRQETGAGADAHLLAMPLDVADGHEGERGAVFALHAERRAERAALHAAVRLAQPALARLACAATRRGRRSDEGAGSFRKKTSAPIRHSR